MNVQEEFLKAYESFADAIFRHCYFRVYKHEQAKDLTQQTFMKVWQYLANGNQVENLRALLYKTANNLIIDESRRKRELTSLEELEERGSEPSMNPLPSWDADMDQQRIMPYLEQLDEGDRKVLILRYVDDLSPKEIAIALDESANVISVRLHRAIKRLRLLIPSYVLPI